MARALRLNGKGHRLILPSPRLDVIDVLWFRKLLPERLNVDTLIRSNINMISFNVAVSRHLDYLTIERRQLSIRV